MTEKNKTAPSGQTERELYSWCRAALPEKGRATWSLLAGDASFRRYYRIAFPTGSYVAVHAPPAQENSRNFTKIARLLHQADIPVPLPRATDYQRGFLLVPDFGDRLLLAELHTNGADPDLWYQKALRTLLRIQGISTNDCRDYDEKLLHGEMALFRDWFLSRLLEIREDRSTQSLLDDSLCFLVRQARQQPQVFVHRDYHSRNLMVSDTGQLAVLDFQDACRGPLAYDLVSLLRDCYIAWPQQRVHGWVRDFLQLAAEQGRHYPCDAQELLSWMDIMGLQRHLKVLGIFARLQLRDNKEDYLRHLPLVMHYVEQAASRQPQLAGFHHWFRRQIVPHASRQPWYYDPAPP